jgi:hypothetical protein
MTKHLLHSFSMILLAAISACAQDTIKIRIPFSFHVGNSVMPSGYYTADTNIGTSVLRLRSDDGKSAVMILSAHVQANAPSAQTKMVFHKYADKYFLYQCWTAGNKMGTELHKSKSESVVAASLQSDTQTILARR